MPASRFIARLVVKLLYRLSAYRTDRVPGSGGCLVVCNHASKIDRQMLRAAFPRPLTTTPDAKGDEAIRVAAIALDRGEAVLVFPEGHVTRSGHMLPFDDRVAAILAKTTTQVAVVPAATDGLWGGVFSYHGGRAIWKRPRAWRPHVGVMFGEAIEASGVLASRERERPESEQKTPVAHAPGSPLQAPELRLAVQELAAECASHQAAFLLPLHRQFVRTAVKLRNIFRTCVIDNAAGERILTFGKVFVATMCVTRYLRSRVGSEPNVGVWLPTGVGSMFANLALAILGKTSVNLNYTAGTEAVLSAARQAGLRLVVTSKRFVLRVPLELPDDIPRVYAEDILEGVTKGQQIRTFLMALLLPGWFIDLFVLGLGRHSIDDVLTIVFSSGSTGEPKGIILTQRNVGSNVDAAVRTIDIRPADSLMGVLPFFHSFGYTVALWAPLIAAATAVYYPDPRAAKEVGNLVKKHRATLVLSTATFLRFYIRRCEADDFRTVRIMICGAEKLPVKLQDEFQAKFGVLPLEGYGCTELSPVVSTNLHDLTVDGFTQVCNVRGTIGQPIVGLAVRAFTQESREPLPTGVEGVLCGKGPNVMSGYLHQPEKTKDVIRDGWYYTGDVGLVRPDGFIQITGRVSRFAKIAGEMVPLERLEEELHDLVGGGDRVLVVAAVPDEKRGERLVVLFLPDLEGKLAGMLDSLAGRGIPNLWVPDIRDSYKIDSLPALGSGKLDLKRVGELAWELAGLR